MSSDSSSQSAVIFDGTDMSISFKAFLIQLLKESHGGREPTDVVPAHLYGEALRFFESLDILCQDNSSRLVSVMSRRFPGSSGTQNPHDHQLSASDDQTMPTLAASPPHTFALYKSPSFSTPELSSLALKGNGSKFNLLARKRSNIFSSWKDKLHVNIRPFRSKTPPPPRVFTPLEITIHSFFIEKFPFRHHPGPGTLIAEIDLNDRQAVEKAKNQQLLSVHRNDMR
ncbi:hypothetical protein FRC04_009625 [Tulasnella sp. 424]|nr:hypothetical protein FRC04_009625 [Tulasnella sp. 424]